MTRNDHSHGKPRLFTTRKTLGRSHLRCAIAALLYGVPCAALAQQATAPAAGPGPAPTGNELSEITVTATRRTETLESVPYSISVVTAAQLAQSGVTDLASLANQVPGLSLYDYGTRFSSATPPIIRGINATSSPRGFRSFEQDPVGTYIGNSPVFGYYPIEDISRVEVLRGPQGTLYGAGALGGAVRLIPNSPELGKFSADIEGSGSRLDHSSGTGYSATGVANLPIGDTVAIRVSGKYQYTPGFIDAFGLLSRSNSGLYGVPLLADPGDPVNSPGIYHSENDWNWNGPPPVVQRCSGSRRTASVPKRRCSTPRRQAREAPRSTPPSLEVPFRSTRGSPHRRADPIRSSRRLTSRGPGTAISRAWT